MSESEKYEKSFSNAAYEAEPDGITFENKASTTRRNTLIIGVIVILLCSIGAGIGIGYAIGMSQDQEPGDQEPIVGSEPNPSKLPPPTVQPDTEQPPTESPGTEQPPTEWPQRDWIDLPCTDRPARCPAGISSPPVLLISVDGFWADFLSRGLTPVISRMAECGVSAPYMIPSFPTVTFPNHYTIVTGLYPESHSIVGNSMYDPVFDADFSLGSSESTNSRWWGGEPIWNTARWQGKRSATFFWPGSDADIQGIRPNYWNKYDGDVNYRQRVDTVLGWLRLPDGYRPDVVTLYFDEPDHTGHDPGPNTPEENEVLQQMDGILRRLMDGLVAMDMQDCVNTILISDHGMSNRTCDQTFTLDDYLPSSDYRVLNTAGTMLRIAPNDGAAISDPNEIVKELTCKHEVAIPFVKTDLPKRWHYVNNRRIEPVEVPVPEQWTASGGPTTWCDGGAHGYDNLGNLMKALFIAIGPGFKSQIEVQPFPNIELYNLMCELMDVEPAPNNGTLGSLHHIMRSPKSLPDVAPTPTHKMDCPYPASDQDYNDRLANDISGCTCAASDIKSYDMQLDLSTEQVDLAMETHAPLGAPVVNFDSEYCELAQTDYVAGYSHDLRTPLWTSYSLKRPETGGQEPTITSCLARPDVRVDAEYSPSCSDYANVTKTNGNMTISYLYPPAFTDSFEREMDALISSNIVPQFKGFVDDLWDGFIIPHLALWANISSDINVIVGPVFDFDGDSFRDNNDTLESEGQMFGDGPTVIPTHYYMIVARCKGGAELNSACLEVQTASFVLRNIDGIKTCQTQADYMEYNIATVRDIEKLTGLTFFPDLPVYESIQLKLYAPTKGDLWRNWPLL